MLLSIVLYNWNVLVGKNSYRKHFSIDKYLSIARRLHFLIQKKSWLTSLNGNVTTDNFSPTISIYRYFFSSKSKFLINKFSPRKNCFRQVFSIEEFLSLSFPNSIDVIDSWFLKERCYWHMYTIEKFSIYGKTYGNFSLWISVCRWLFGKQLSNIIFSSEH